MPRTGPGRPAVPAGVDYHRAMSDVLVVLIVILVVVLVLRGPKTLPELGRMFGRGVKAARDEARDIKKGDGDSTKP